MLGFLKSHSYRHTQQELGVLFDCYLGIVAKIIKRSIDDGKLVKYKLLIV
jgi:hypothetical protein